MIKACLTASDIDGARLADIAQGFRRHFHFVPPVSPYPRPGPRPARLHLTAGPLPEPILVNQGRGVVVSTSEAEGICRYTGIDEQTYLLVCSLIGMMHWRVLRDNALLRPEDLRHPPGIHCVCNHARDAADLALLLDSPVVCKGCNDFYHCLGADSELLALREVVQEIASGGRHDRLAS